MSTSDFTKYLESFDLGAYGAGSSKGTDRYSGLDVRMNIDKGREMGLSDDEIGRGIQSYYNTLDDDVRHGGSTQDAMQKVFDMIGSSSAKDDEPAENPNESYEETIPTFSPQVKEAISRVNSYRDRAWSGQHAQDVYGRSKTLTNGIPAGAGSSGQDKTGEAADSTIRQAFQYGI